MKKNYFSAISIAFTFLCLFLTFNATAQHTFSIVAVDPVTGEIGSAGATCISSEDGAQDISDIILGVGAIHTQSFWDPTNQANARTRMEAGDSPSQIITWLQNNDVSGAASVQDRQYGIVDIHNGAGRSAAFTGTNNYDEKGHRLGANYAIQGNILISQDVLDDMEAAFLNTSGPLCEKLMAVMQAAKRPGADSRCLSFNISSASAFIRVAKPTDTDSSYGNLWLDLNVWLNSGTFTGDPIDELQNQFDAFKATLSTDEFNYNRIKIYPNPAKDLLNIETQNNTIDAIELYNILGEKILAKNITSDINQIKLDLNNYNSGVYIMKIIKDATVVKTSKIVIE